MSELYGFADPSSEFELTFDQGAITSLKPRRDAGAEYIQRGQRLGEIIARWREAGQQEWHLFTNVPSGGASVSPTNASSGSAGISPASISAFSPFTLDLHFAIQQRAILWTIRIQNLSTRQIEIGDLAMPLPITRSGPNRSVILKHSFISGNGSFLFWMRSDLVAPHLVLLPIGSTKLEYWEGSRQGGYRVFIHSAAAGAEIKARSSTWRQPHTSLALAPKGKSGDTQTYELKFRWADDYDAIRQILVDEGGMDVQVVPGMTVPNDLFAQLALRSGHKINSVEAEFPTATDIKPLGKRGEYRLFQIHFSKLGENRLAIRYGKGCQTFLEFFCAEPIETLLKKRAAFLARSQHRDPARWYNGLITDWNMGTQKLLSPDDYDPIPRNRYYAVTCDDPGLGKPAFLAAKNAEFPVQTEVDALDYYIQHFVWGGLQRTTEEKYSYAVYGIPDWKTNRESPEPGRTGQLHFWREYDYPHVILLYFNMYRLAKNHPDIKTALSAKEYLQRACGTARAFFTIPHEVWPNWSPYGTGLYNELVIVELMDELDRVGMKTEADTLRSFWDRKVRHFVEDGEDLFRSEYAFDTTGFESTHAIAKYAIVGDKVRRPKTPTSSMNSTNLVMASPSPPREERVGERRPSHDQDLVQDQKLLVQAENRHSNSGITVAHAKRFMETQIAANLFCRGCLEPAYYLLGSDIRGAGGNAYTLTYMSQMGGWSVLDYGLNFATNRAPYLRLGYASYLSAWALMNTGTPESNYGYWYPGKSNDGAAAGGFEPSANGRMWLVPALPLGRGAWCFASEIDLGYCGALRSAATILADDPIFGRFCFGGDWRKTGPTIEVIPKDGLRRRFHARLKSGNLSMILDGGRFAPAQPIVIKEDLSEIRFQLEREALAKTALLSLQSLPQGDYIIRSAGKQVAQFKTTPLCETSVELKTDGTLQGSSFSILKLR